MREIASNIKNMELLKSRRNDIAEAGYKLFSKSGFMGTSVEEVAKFLNVDKRTLYNYLEKKEDLLYVVFCRYLPIFTEEVSAKINQISDPREKLKTAIKADLELTSEYENFVMLVSRELRYLDEESIQSTLELIKKNYQIFENILKEGIESGVFKPHNPTIVTFAIKAQIHMIATYRWGLRDFSFKEIASQIIDNVLGGIGQ